MSLPVTVYAAADLVITCPATGDSCELTPEVSLFTETNLYPGYVQDPAQKVTFVNERTDQCHLKMIVENVSGDHLLNQVVGIKAFSDTKTFINSTLDQLMLYHHTISIVPPQTAQTYSWLTWIDPAAGNEFQNLTTQFDQVYHFTCAPPPTPTPTPTATLSPTPTLTPTVTPTPTQTNTPTPTSTNIPILTPHIGNTSTSTTPTPSILSTPEILPTTTQSLSTQESGEILCNDVAPDKPGSFFVRPNRGGGSAILTWTSPQSPHTGYQIVMGSEPSQLIYRSIDVGKINTYTVKSLTPGAQYCFYVQTTNGCALSSRTQTDCINVGSPVIAIQKPSEEFKENVLGAIDTTGSQMGQVLGATTNTCRLTNSSILFFIAALLGLVLYLLFHKTIHIGAHILISVFLSSLVMVLTVYFYQICRSHHMIVYYLSCVVPIGIMFIHTALKDHYEKEVISKKS